MSKRAIIQNTLVIVLGLAIICMSVGYAAYRVDVNVVGESVIETPSWDVHLETPIKTYNTTVVNDNIILSPKINEDGTQVDFSVLMAPGDIYEFTIDVRNSGTLDAKLSNYSLTGETEGVTVSDDDVEYEVYGVVKDESLKKGSYSTKTIRVKAKEKENAEIVDGMVEAHIYNFKFNIYYVQNN